MHLLTNSVGGKILSTFLNPERKTKIDAPPALIANQPTLYQQNPNGVQNACKNVPCKWLPTFYTQKMVCQPILTRNFFHFGVESQIIQKQRHL